MTLTYPVLNRARRVLWLATGNEKRQMLARLRAADASIPAGRIEQAHAIVLTDRAASGSE
jgi:6-phosphogluconolactonase